MLKYVLGLSLIVLAAAAQQAPPAPRRMALVVGNGGYQFLPKLPGIAQDTAAIEAALKADGFDVTPVADFKYRDFFATARKFEGSLQKGDVAFVYYAGYVVQADNDNYLLPVDFDPHAKTEMQQRAYHFTRLIQDLEQRGVALKVFVLDAPPQIEIALPEVTDIGLMQPDLADARETVFASAVFPGHWAPPNPEGKASPFTEAVAKAISEPGLTLTQVFDLVKQECALTQTVYVNSSVVRQLSFYFRAPLPVKKEPVPVAPPPTPPEWPRTGIPVVNKTDREEYLWIKPGTFLMGCADSDARCAPAEKPQHKVTITAGFWMGRNEVQVGSYERYTKARSLKMPSPPLDRIGWKVSDRPIANVKWEDAANYCAWAGGRLPTEAEWEMAARGGAENRIFPMSGGEDSREKANFYGKKGNDSYEFAAPVRKFDPNPFGLYDMAGNVWEWVSDFYSPNYYSESPATDPKGPAAGKDHVARGGSYDSDPKEHLRISFRRGFSGTWPNVGFRCVLPKNALPEPK